MRPKTKSPCMPVADALMALTIEAPVLSEPPRTRNADPWDGLFAWGDQFRKATGITKADVRKAVEEVRACKS